MSVMAYALRDSKTRLWGLSARERLKRQLKQIGGVVLMDNQTSEDEILKEPAEAGMLLIDANFLFEPRTLAELLDKPDTILYLEDRPAAAFVMQRHVEGVLAVFKGDANLPPELKAIHPGELSAFDDKLRRSEPPLLERVTSEQKPQLESRLYGNAYKGITDLVTKWWWPRPARQGVRICANLGITPNMVTSVGFLLVLAACFLFLHGYYLAGLLCGWVMTFLDTVDGKLARVTIQSSPFGHYFDHGIDLVHPPFWYYFWGVSLTNFDSFLGLTSSEMVNWIIGGYIIGRIVEGLFQLLGSCGIFTWRPFDAWVRLFTARRNPCLIILSVSVVLGNPDWGFIGVFLWTCASSLQLVLRLLQGVWVRISAGPLSSWLADEKVQQKYARAYAVFGGTRAAYREVDS